MPDRDYAGAGQFGRIIAVVEFAWNGQEQRSGKTDKQSGHEKSVSPFAACAPHRLSRQKTRNTATTPADCALPKGASGRARKLTALWNRVYCIAFCLFLLPRPVSADDCWWGPGCLVKVLFQGSFCTPERLLVRPFHISSGGSRRQLLDHWTAASSVQAPPWIARLGG